MPPLTVIIGGIFAIFIIVAIVLRVTGRIEDFSTYGSWTSQSTMGMIAVAIAIAFVVSRA